MKQYYYVKYAYEKQNSKGESWVVYRLWFWQNLVNSINETLSRLEKDLGASNISIIEIKKL